MTNKNLQNQEQALNFQHEVFPGTFETYVRLPTGPNGSPSEPVWAFSLNRVDMAPQTFSQRTAYWDEYKRQHLCTLWHELREYVDDPCNKDKPYVACTICTKELALPWGFQSRDRARKNKEQERAAVLCCGHIVGAKCLRTFARTVAADPRKNLKYRCPVCNRRMTHEDCGHNIDHVLLPYEENYDQSSWRIPTTLEDKKANARVLSNCYDCLQAMTFQEPHSSVRELLKKMPLTDDATTTSLYDYAYKVSNEAYRALRKEATSGTFWTAQCAAGCTGFKTLGPDRDTEMELDESEAEAAFEGLKSII